MTTRLKFQGEARAAMEFYRSVFGGELDLSTFAESGAMGLPEAEQGNVMHAQLTVAEGVVLMASDVPSVMPASVPGGHPVSLSGDDDAVLRAWWSALSEGAEITVPLAAAPWGDSFGTLRDRYGVEWLINIAGGSWEPDAPR